jgi:hypothetical protein
MTAPGAVNDDDPHKQDREPEALMDKNRRPTQSPGSNDERHSGLGLFIGMVALVAVAIIAIAYVRQLVS